MPRRPYQTPRLRLVTAPTPAMRSILAQAKAIRESKARLQPTARADHARLAEDARAPAVATAIRDD
jgi:hypothetical protein